MKRRFGEYTIKNLKEDINKVNVTGDRTCTLRRMLDDNYLCFYIHETNRCRMGCNIVDLVSKWK